jgi:hypothetical protein
MHTALAIIAHALRMLIFQTSTTVRVLMPALVIILGSASIAAMIAPDAIAALQAPSDDMVVPDASTLLLLAGLSIAGLLGYALMAILWHRHVLLNGAEDPSALMPGRPIFFAYVGRAIMVGLMQLLASLPIALAMALAGSILVPTLGGLALLLIGVIGGLAFVWIALRISVVLPAAAVGNAMSLRDSWHATAPLNSVIWGIAALLACLNAGLAGLTNILFPDLGSIALILQTVIYLVEGLVFISVLTTLYGNLVEGRSLG